MVTIVNHSSLKSLREHITTEFTEQDNMATSRTTLRTPKPKLDGDYTLTFKKI